MTVHRGTFVAAVVLGFVLSAAAPAQQPAAPPLPDPLTVEQAVALALQQNPTIVLAGQDVQAAQAQVAIARTNRSPQVNLTLTETYNPSPQSFNIDGNEVALSQRFSTNAAVTGSVPVWPHTRWRAPIAAAQANVGATQSTQQRTRQQVAFATRQSFYQVLNAQELLTVAQDAVRVAREQLRLARSTVDAGLAAPLDVFQAQAALSNAEVNAQRAQNAVDLAVAALVTQIGLPAGTPLRVQGPAELPAAAGELAALTQTALAQRPELTQLNFRRAQVRANMELIRLEKKPLINVQASWNKSLFSDASALGGDGFTVSAAAAVNLFNGGRTNAELDAARIQLAQLDTTARQIELGITLDVRSAWLGLQNALQQLTAAEEGRRAAAEALRIAELRYQNGEGIVLEVEQARLNLTQASTAQAQARYQAQVSAAQLQLAVGDAAQG